MYKLVLSLNVFFSETPWPIFTRFHIGLSVEGVLSICSNGSASVNKMSIVLIYGKIKKKEHFKTYFSRTKKASRLNLGIQHRGLKVYQVDSNDDSRLIFDLSMARSNLHSHILVRGKYCKIFWKCIKDRWLILSMYDRSSSHFSHNQNFVLLSYLPLPLGYLHV